MSAPKFFHALLLHWKPWQSLTSFPTGFPFPECYLSGIIQYRTFKDRLKKKTTEYNIFEIQPHSFVYQQFVLIHCWVIFHCIYPLIHWKTLFFSSFQHYEKSCCKHLGTDFFKSVYFSRVSNYKWEVICLRHVQLHKTLTNFPPTMCKTSIRFIFSTTLSTVIKKS